jgi:hypothetical protein
MSEATLVFQNHVTPPDFTIPLLNRTMGATQKKNSWSVSGNPETIDATGTRKQPHINLKDTLGFHLLQTSIATLKKDAD